MLPDFPVLKKKMLQYWNTFTDLRRRQYIASMGFAGVPSHQHYEGNRWLMQREDGSESESDYKEATSGFSLPDADVPQLSREQLANQLDELARDMADQMGEHLFKSLHEEIASTNRIVSGNSRQFDKEVFLEALEQLMINFDEHDNPIMPTIFISPNLGEHVKEQLELWNNDPDMEKRFNQIIERKREEWHVRENSRRLVE